MRITPLRQVYSTIFIGYDLACKTTSTQCFHERIGADAAGNFSLVCHPPSWSAPLGAVRGCARRASWPARGSRATRERGTARLSLSTSQRGVVGRSGWLACIIPGTLWLARTSSRDRILEGLTNESTAPPVRGTRS